MTNQNRRNLYCKRKSERMYYYNVFVVNERHEAWAVFFKFMSLLLNFLTLLNGK
jgi:hypothetical protein